jgi:2-dehydro-3-deoxygluconokinase
VRRGSAASGLGPADLPEAALERARALLTTGVACAISESSAAAVERAVSLVRGAGGVVVYDPNYRRRLTSAESAARMLRRLAPAADVVTPSCPGDSGALLGTDDPESAARSCLRLGARAVVVTCGPEGAVIDGGSGTARVRPAPVPRLVDATGAGDVLAGTVAARIALGDDLETAARLGCSAAALSLGGPGGTGHLPTLAETRANLRGSNSQAPSSGAASGGPPAAPLGDATTR